MQDLEIVFPIFEPVTRAELAGKTPEQLRAIFNRVREQADEVNRIFNDKCFRLRIYESAYNEAIRPVQVSFDQLADAFYPLHFAYNPAKAARAQRERELIAA